MDWCYFIKSSLGYVFGSETGRKRLATRYLSLSSDFGQLLESGEASDAQLVCGGGIVRQVHRCVLTGRSPVFAAMFRSNMAESATGVVHIEDFDAGAVDKFLVYLYAGRLPEDIPVDALRELYAMADKYAVQSLKTMCSDMLIEQISDRNFLELLRMVLMGEDEKFKKAVIRCIVDHPWWLNCKAWRLFSEDNWKVALDIHGRVKEKHFEDIDLKEENRELEEQHCDWPF